MTIYIPSCDIELVLVGQVIINILINNHINPTALLPTPICQRPDTTMPVTGHPIKNIHIYFLYFNTVNLSVSLHDNINDLGCIRYCWKLINSNFPLQTTLNMFTVHRPCVFLEIVMNILSFIVSLK